MSSAEMMRSRVTKFFRKQSTAAPASTSDSQPQPVDRDPSTTKTPNEAAVTKFPPTTPAPAAVPPTARVPRDLWLEAIEKLPKEANRELHITDSTHMSQPTAILQHNCNTSTQLQQIQDLASLAKKRQEECEKKFWKFRVGDHEVVLRDYAVTIIGSLQKIGDVAIQFAPPQASIPWTAVKVLMQAPIIESAQMGALLASVDRIVRIINRGQVYELVYTTPATPELAFQNLQAALIDLYSAVLELLANSTKLFAKDTAERTIYAILHPSETADLFSKLVKLETQLDREVQACESGRSAAVDAALTDLLQKLEAPLIRVDEKVSSLLERVDAREQLDLLEWISPILYRKHHDTVKEARTPGTCQWLLQHNRFREWENTSSSVIMWLQGSPGAGKTFLTSEVIDHVQTLLGTAPNHEGFAFFYCNRNEKDRQDPLCVLRSYVRQLSTVAYSPGEMRGKLRNLCHKTKLKGSDLTFDTCREQLLESVNLYPKTTLVLDALDECEPDTRGRLVDALEFLLQKCERPLKVFISSRPDGDIRDRFISRPNIEIQATDNQGDIAKFVKEEIIKHRRWRKISLPLQMDIVDTLLNRSQGMFQWAFLQIKQLLELQTESAIKDRLGKLPVNLEDTYNEIYDKIAARHEHERILADRAFMWVMCACKPLSSAELLGAIRLDPKSDIMPFSEELDEDQLLEVCNNMLVLDSQRKVWRFSHLSVTEYFEKNHWSLLQAHCHAAKVCLVLLGMKRPGNEVKVRSPAGRVHRLERSLKPNDILDLRHPLQSYCDHHWIIHVQTQERLEVDPTLARYLKAFLGSPNESSSQYRVWYGEIAPKIGRPDPLHRTAASASFSLSRDELSPETSAILTMCRFALYYTLSDWWADAEIALSLHNGAGDNLLTLAALAGCKPICELLLRRGMEVNMLLPSSHYGSALAAAASQGKIEIVKFLVEEGAEINMPLQTERYGSALAAAVSGGNIEIVKFLVEKGAKVNMPLQTRWFGSALSVAASGGKIDIVKFLIEKGAEVNMPLQTGDFGSALTAAAYWANIEIFKFLMEKGAEVNMPLQTGRYGSVLAAAASGDRIENVKFLVEKGAEINMPLQTGDYGSALAAAASQEEIEIVKFLVEKGAEVNTPLQTGEYGSALSAAAEWANIENVKFLIEKGAEVNMLLQIGRYGSALEVAVREQEIEIVKFLVEKGANVNMPLQIGRYGSALAAAACCGKIEIVEFLIKKGAEVDMPLHIGQYGSALAVAAYFGWKTCVEALIEGGAKVDLVLGNGLFITALEAAGTDITSNDVEESLWWDERNDERLRQEKAQVAAMLSRTRGRDRLGHEWRPCPSGVPPYMLRYDAAGSS